MSVAPRETEPDPRIGRRPVPRGAKVEGPVVVMVVIVAVMVVMAVMVVVAVVAAVVVMSVVAVSFRGAVNRVSPVAVPAAGARIAVVGKRAGAEPRF